ncbi:reticulophagy regulator 3-like [Argonauta hians]
MLHNSVHQPAMASNNQQMSLLEAILSPWQPWIYTLQSLLIWEKPHWTIVWLCFMHLLFWLFSNVTLSFYSCCCCSVILFFILDLLVNKVWKKITSVFLSIIDRFRRRFKFPVPDRQISAPSHLLSVPELCHQFNEFMSCIQSTLRRWLNFRRKHPLRFCLTNTYICFNLAIAGCYVPGIIITYIIGVFAFIICPPVVYYRMPQRLQMKLEPVTSRIMYVLSFFNVFCVIFRAIRGDGCTPDNEINSQMGMPSDMTELYPEVDPTALSTTATESDEGERSPEHLTPALSENQSIENSEDEHETDIEQDLAEGLGEEMPSFDDHTDDELLDSKPSDAIQFVPTHFDSDSDDGEFSLDSKTIDRRAPSKDRTIDRRASSKDRAIDRRDPPKDSSADIERNITENIVAQAMGSMMQMALKGLSNPMVSEPVQQMPEDPDDEDFQGYETATVKRRRKVQPVAPPPHDMEYSDSELADDFEFLDSTELDDH